MNVIKSPITGLQNVSKILKSEFGRYSLVIPDKRYCFDALIPETKITEIIEAFESGATKPSFWKLVEQSYLTFKQRENEMLRQMFGEGADMFIKEPRLNKDWIQGGTYLWHLVKKNYQGPIPALTINTPFTPEI
jgi:hypothetical protein